MFHIEFLYPIFRKKNQITIFFLHLLFFTCLWLKMILVLKWHILEWHILASFITHYPLIQIFFLNSFFPLSMTRNKASNRLQKHMENKTDYPKSYETLWGPFSWFRKRKNKVTRTQVAQHFSSPLACLCLFSELNLNHWKVNDYVRACSTTP